MCGCATCNPGINGISLIPNSNHGVTVSVCLAKTVQKGVLSDTCFVKSVGINANCFSTSTMSDNHSDTCFVQSVLKNAQNQLVNKLSKLLGVCLAHCVGQCLWGSVGPVVVRDMGLVQQALCLTTTL